jgi:hypothetical protein
LLGTRIFAKRVLEFIQQHDELKNLGVSVMFWDKDESYSALLRNEKFLRVTTKLAVHNESPIDLSDYWPIFSSTLKLEWLELDIFSALDEDMPWDDKPAFCDSLKHLELRIQSKEVPSILLRMLGKVNNLRVLYFSHFEGGGNRILTGLLNDESSNIWKSVEVVSATLDVSEDFDFSVFKKYKKLKELEIVLTSSGMSHEAEKRWDNFLQSNKSIKTLSIKVDSVGGGRIPDIMLASIARYARGIECISLRDNKSDIFGTLFSEKPNKELRKSLRTLEITDNPHLLKRGEWRGAIKNLATCNNLEHLAMLAPERYFSNLFLYSFGIQIPPRSVREMRGEEWESGWAAIKGLKLKENTLWVMNYNINVLTYMIDGNKSVERLFVYFKDEVGSFNDLVDCNCTSRLDALLAAILETVQELHLSGEKGQLSGEHIGILFREGSGIWKRLKRVYVRSGIVDGGVLKKLQTKMKVKGVEARSVVPQKYAISWDRPVGTEIFYEREPFVPLHVGDPYALGIYGENEAWGGCLIQ